LQGLSNRKIRQPLQVSLEKLTVLAATSIATFIALTATLFTLTGRTALTALLAALLTTLTGALSAGLTAALLVAALLTASSTLTTLITLFIRCHNFSPCKFNLGE
jgi:hypothetical protein